jgi:hypothetical protein
MKKSIFGLALFLVSSMLSANTTAKISNILLYEGGNLVYIWVEGGVTNPPACHGSNGDYMSFSMARPMAKEYLSMLMMAFAANKTVFFRTDGACTDQSVSETIRYISVTK